MEEDEPRLAAPTANILDDDDDDDYVPEPTEMENSSERPKRESKPPRYLFLMFYNKVKFTILLAQSLRHNFIFKG